MLVCHHDSRWPGGIQVKLNASTYLKPYSVGFNQNLEIKLRFAVIVRACVFYRDSSSPD